MTAPNSRARSDDGFSLVEMIAAVALLSIAVVAILSALGVLIRSSREHRQMANAQVVLASAAEKVKAADYVPCTDGLTSLLAGYDGAADTATQPTDWASGASIDVIEVRYWVDGTGFIEDIALCLVDGGLQEVTVQVTSPDGATTDAVSLLKGGLEPADDPGDPGGPSPCFLKSPTAEFLGNGGYKSPVKVKPDNLETFTLHLEPSSCPEGRWPLSIYIPGADGVAETTLVPNPTSTDPTWEAEDVRMPPATTSGWETKGNILTAFVYDSFGAEAGRFWLEVT